MHTNPHPTRIAPRFLASNALSLLGNSIAAVALPLILLGTTRWTPARLRSSAPCRR